MKEGRQPDEKSHVVNCVDNSGMQVLTVDPSDCCTMATSPLESTHKDVVTPSKVETWSLANAMLCIGKKEVDSEMGNMLMKIVRKHWSTTH